MVQPVYNMILRLDFAGGNRGFSIGIYSTGIDGTHCCKRSLLFSVQEVLLFEP
jgi:hypothetical protein